MAWQKFLAFYDLHVMHQCDLVVDRIEDEIARRQPDYLICGGDLFEAIAASRWENEDEDELYDEFDTANRILARFSKAAPNAKKKWVRGNHDDNVIEKNRIPKKLRKMCDFRRPSREFPEFSTWDQYPYETNRNRCAFRIGQVLFMHGFETSDAGLNRQMYEYCDPWGLLVTGHTHRPTELIQAEVNKTPLPFWRISCGCAQDFRDPEKVHYMKRKSRARWGHGIVIGEADPVKSPRAGRYWDAEPVIFSVGADDSDTGKWEPKR